MSPKKAKNHILKKVLEKIYEEIIKFISEIRNKPIEKYIVQ